MMHQLIVKTRDYLKSQKKEGQLLPNTCAIVITLNPFSFK